jgi:hypothetical protein
MTTDAFYRSPVINQLDLVLTTHCNLRCPECAAFIPYLTKREHFDLDYIKGMASFFKGIEILRVVGGEPMMHPGFDEIIPALRGLFECKILILTTNGYRAKEHKETLKFFNHLLVSKYDRNQEEVAFIEHNFLDMKSSAPTYHVPLSRRAKDPVPCWRHKAGIFMVYGKIFPCCMGLAPESIGIIPTVNWKEEIIHVPLPCKTCCFAEEKYSPIGHNWFNEKMPLESIKIEGVFDDLWVGEKVLITVPASLHQYCGSKKINLEIQSLAPQEVYPIKIGAFLNNNAVDEIMLINDKTMQWTVLLRDLCGNKDAVVTLQGSKLFRPSEYRKDNHDNRMLSFRLLTIAMT